MPNAERQEDRRTSIDQVAAMAHALLFLFSPLVWGLYDPSLLMLVMLVFAPAGVVYILLQLIVIWLISIGRLWSVLAAGAILLCIAVVLLTVTNWGIHPMLYLGPMILPALVYCAARALYLRRLPKEETP